MSGAPARDTLLIRPANEADWPGIWTVFEPIVRDGETYPLDPELDEVGARAYWFAPDKTIFVAADPAQGIVGSYYLKSNSTGPAAHVCNAGYIVHPAARGRGVAQALCRHSIEEARRRGYRAMQYNLVISTNDRAVRLWQHMGFTLVGALPGAFRRPNGDYVDALVMYQSVLED
ncbi:MAG: GNAT family N-acetyltransferase [Sphingobium sp.]|nr:GNAT family N-acetyltransferase [Sphingobium sp.]